ncbi:MAG: NAD(P)/FAD-dependent oxidoreductase [Betaproteobacteria bacterium]|nr:NAD(P)/FAD-dependent oxidoreductase [Betaproteobacteria bacterium]
MDVDFKTEGRGYRGEPSVSPDRSPPALGPGGTYDAIIIGAGPAGSMCALLLARAGWSVAVIEKASFPRRKVCGEFISASALSLIAQARAADAVLARAGPEIREVGFYAGNRIVTAPLPAYAGVMQYGRALGREHLDAALLDEATRAGAAVWQPWAVESTGCDGDMLVCRARNADTGERVELNAAFVIRAHGSVDTGRLRVPGVITGKRASDLLAFKTHFTGGALPPAQMPLLAFPGGYSGFVHTDGGRVSVSCCIRRDALAAVRRAAPGTSAGEAVWNRVLETCRGAREALRSAVQEEAWLAAGPLRPGMRAAPSDGTLAVGNAMGEAEPSVAEGITIGIQSASLLSGHLLRANRSQTAAGRAAIACDYDAAYRRHFSQRIRWSRVVGRLTMNAHAAGVAAAVMTHVPRLLTLGAAWSGKKGVAAA